MLTNALTTPLSNLTSPLLIFWPSWLSLLPKGLGVVPQLWSPTISFCSEAFTSHLSRPGYAKSHPCHKYLPGPTTIFLESCIITCLASGKGDAFGPWRYKNSVTSAFS
jgi:hypothetical protein